MNRFHWIFADHFSSPGGAVGLLGPYMCVSVSAAFLGNYSDSVALVAVSKGMWAVKLHSVKSSMQFLTGGAD